MVSPGVYMEAAGPRVGLEGLAGAGPRAAARSIHEYMIICRLRGQAATGRMRALGSGRWEAVGGKRGGQDVGQQVG